MQIVDRHTSLRAFFKEVQQKPWTTSVESRSQCQSGEVVAKLKKYMKFSRDLEGYISITTQAADKMIGPDGSMGQWINSVVLQQQQQQPFNYDCKAFFVETILSSYSSSASALGQMLKFYPTISSSADVIRDGIIESQQKSLALKNDFMANAEVAKQQNSDRVWQGVFNQGVEVLRSITDLLEGATRLRQKVELERKHDYDLATVKYNVSKIHNDIKRELELTKRMSYYREDYVQMRDVLEVDLFSLRQSVATVQRHLAELETKNTELLTQFDQYDNWKMHETEYALLLKMAKGNTDRAALIKEREEHDDAVEWKRICSASDYDVVRQQQQQHEQEQRQRQIDEAELAARERAIEEHNKKQLEMHKRRLLELQMQDRNEAAKIEAARRFKEAYPANVPNPDGVTDDGSTAERIGSTN